MGGHLPASAKARIEVLYFFAGGRALGCPDRAIGRAQYTGCPGDRRGLRRLRAAADPYRLRPRQGSAERNGG